MAACRGPHQLERPGVLWRYVGSVNCFNMSARPGHTGGWAEGDRRPQPPTCPSSRHHHPSTFHHVIPNTDQTTTWETDTRKPIFHHLAWET